MSDKLNEKIDALVEEKNKTIDDLQKQIEEAKLVKTQYSDCIQKFTAKYEGLARERLKEKQVENGKVLEIIQGIEISLQNSQSQQASDDLQKLMDENQKLKKEIQTKKATCESFQQVCKTLHLEKQAELEKQAKDFNFQLSELKTSLNTQIGAGKS